VLHIEDGSAKYSCIKIGDDVGYRFKKLGILSFSRLTPTGFKSIFGKEQKTNEKYFVRTNRESKGMK